MDRKPAIFKRENGIFYWRIPPDGKWKSTGARIEADAWRIVWEKAGAPGSYLAQIPGLTLGHYAADFFIWDKCSRIAHLRLKGKRISPEHAAAQRSILVRHILGDKDHEADPLAAMPLAEIDRPALDAFERRLAARLGIVEGSPRHRRLFNAVLVALSTIFKWAIREKVYHQANPVGGELLAYEKQERGIFTAKELKKLFPDKTSELGPWRNLRDKAAFMVAANGGLRRSEVRAIRWDSIDSSLGLLTIQRAFKGGGARLGKPKSGKVRYVKLTENTIRHLQAWKLATPHKAPEDFAFTHAKGESLGPQWWEGAFVAAVDKIGIDRKTRGIVPHSLRHSLNSHLRAVGVPDFLIRESLGWNSEAIQADYSHTIAEHLEPVAKAVANLF
jgi:integrase